MTGDTIVTALTVAPLQGGLVPRGSRVEVFRQIFEVFLVLGTLVGVVVVGYMLYNAYKYRADADVERGDEDPPTLGELPTGSGGGSKLFLSFGLSTVVVVSLIVWTYGTLLYVEQNPPIDDQAVEIEVVGYQFGWRFIYPNGYTSNTLRVPQGTAVKLTVTSADVFHNFGVRELRVKTDAIPGQTTDSWFIAEETGRYVARCYELCGVGHSYMTAEVVVMPQEEYRNWYANTSAPNGTAANGTAANGTAGNESTHAIANA